MSKTMPDFVTEASASIADSEWRFVESTCSLRNTWFPVSTTPVFGEQEASDRGALDENHPMAREFEEEVSALIEAITRHGDPRTLDEVMAEDGDAAMDRAFAEKMEIRPWALDLWDRHGAPVRLRGNEVFRIRSPRDMLGSPIIRSCPADQYVAQVAVKTAELARDLRKTKAVADRWRMASSILLAILTLIIWRWAR